MIRHAGLVALRLGGRWRGALIEGPSGSGKSDLALRCMDQGFSLVADDRVMVWTSAGAGGSRLYGRAPRPLAGLIEARGVGVLPVRSLDLAEIILAVSCVASPGAVDRLPAEESIEIMGLVLPLRRLWAPEPAAPTKLSLALEYLGAGR